MVNVYLVDYLYNALCIVVASALLQEIKAAQRKRERKRGRELEGEGERSYSADIPG